MTEYDAKDDGEKSYYAAIEAKRQRGDASFCEECGKGYYVKPYRRAKTRYCSFQCGGRARARETLNVGPKLYMRGNKLRAGIRPANAFTSEQVRGSNNHRWQEGHALTCENCGNAFKQKPWVARQNGMARFCSRACFAASGCFSGEKSSTYVGGITTYRGRGWLKVRAIVVGEQSGNCAECEKHVGNSLPVHHVKPFREFATADEANQRNNLIGLCQSCHMKAERRS